MNHGQQQNIRVFNSNRGVFENNESLEINPSDERLSDLLIGGLMGYGLLEKTHQQNQSSGYATQNQQQPAHQQTAQQPRLPYPPYFIPNEQQQSPITNLNQALPYMNRYFYFWPSDDHNIGYWVFVTYIDGLGIRGFHFDGQQFNHVTISPQQVKSFFVY